MQIAAAICASLLTWWESPWRPSKPRRASQTSSLLKFGLDLTASSFVYRMARGCDNILLGRYWGPTSVGLYSRASVLLMRPLDQFLAPIESVLLPVLSRMRAHPERYRRAFLQSYEAIALVSLPMSALFLAIAHPLVMALLGPKWESAAALFAGLTIAALYLPLAAAATWLFTSQGRTRDMLKANLILAVLIVAAFVIGLPYGALGVVLCFSISGLVVRLPLLYYLAGRRGPVHAIELWEALLRQLPVWACVYGATTVAHALTRRAAPLEQLLVCVPVGLAAGVATICALEHQRQTALKLLDAVSTALTGLLPHQPDVERLEVTPPVLTSVKTWFRRQYEQDKYLGLRAA
jgi:PST family polysaccharide transporter